MTTNVTGRRVFKDSALALEASLAAHGLPWLPEYVVGEHLQSAQPPPSRRSSPALARVVEVLRLPEPLQSQLLLGRISDGQHHSLKIRKTESWQWWTGNLGCAAGAVIQRYCLIWDAESVLIFGIWLAV